MKKADFKIYSSLEDVKNEEYVTLRPGKDKKKKLSSYVNAVTFSYIEGMIWDKYREYRNQEKSKISSKEWARIIEGIEETKNDLNNSFDPSKVKEILKFEIIKPKNDLNEIVEHIEDFNNMLSDLIIWLNESMKEESHIYIIK